MSLKNFCFAASAALALAAGSANAQVVISQAYGGGGNAGATYTNDFIELFNRGAAAVDISGWSVQYGSANGASFTALTPIPGVLGSGAVMLQPGQYYLIQEAAGAGGTTALPTPDAIGTIAMGGAGARVALVNNAVALVGACPTGLVDLVGWSTGAVSCFEGTQAPGTGNATAVVRGDGGCTDNGNNSTDFAVLAPTPRNTSSPLHVCSPSTPPSGVGASSPSSVCLSANVVMTVTVTPGASPTSTGIAVTGDLTTLGGGPGVPFLDNGIAPDAVAGDLVFTTQTPASAFFYGNQSVPVAITDAQSRTGNASVVVTVVNCDPSIAFTGSTAACESYPQLLVVNVTPGQSPASTGIAVTADLSSISGGTLTLVDDGTSGDPVAGDGFYGALYTIPSGSASLLTLPISFIDAQSRVASASASITNVGACTNSTSTVVISQLYGGGGNTGATLTNDYVELFNRGSTPVDITGWSLQRLSANGTELTFSAVPANFHQITSGVIQPGQYFLVQEAAGAGGTQALPTPDATGAMTMSASDAMMFLSNSGTLLASFADPAIMDRLGYGTNGVLPLANFEGHGAANSLSNTVASFRHSGGCQDTNNNDVDFYRATPAPRNSSSPIHSCTPGCPADIADTAGVGNPDGAVDINDLLFFLVQFEIGSSEADLANSTGAGIPDGAVDINDLLFFLAHFELGC
jgi:hypothetical protein